MRSVIVDREKFKAQDLQLMIDVFRHLFTLFSQLTNLSDPERVVVGSEAGQGRKGAAVLVPSEGGDRRPRDVTGERCGASQVHTAHTGLHTHAQMFTHLHTHSVRAWVGGVGKGVHVLYIL